MRVILWWLLTVSESYWYRKNCYYESLSAKCGHKCVHMWKKNCECGGTNLTYIDVFNDGKYCCTDQTGAKQNCEIEMILTTII